MTANDSVTQVTINEQGRLVLPLKARKALGISGRETLVVIIEDDQLVLKRRKALIKELRAPFKALRDQGISLSNELVAERREQAHRENKDD